MFVSGVLAVCCGMEREGVCSCADVSSVRRTPDTVTADHCSLSAVGIEQLTDRPTHTHTLKCFWRVDLFDIMPWVHSCTLTVLFPYCMLPP
mmetsp:Transcript_52125/g.130958  ORF Transcript_52125/g.130958 Transcript_52125/m.130958 type:complete len:91 (+) Transcript_52125:834-1106(+)